MTSLWFLVELVEIYQMTYSYMGAISLPYSRKLLVYTFDGHSRAVGGGVPPHIIHILAYTFMYDIEEFDGIKCAL